jgi:GNAT superfamily N-acetyltransferase
VSCDGSIRFASEDKLDVQEFRRVLIDSGLGTIRPVEDPERLARMLGNANLIVTARREDGELIGVARCITDHCWCCYLSDLAVSSTAKGLGIGRGLVAEVRQRLGPEVAIFLASVPDAAGFYERIGMARMEDTFWLERER